MLTLFKEGWLVLRIGYYSIAMKQMGVSHKDYPDVFIHVTYLREQVNSLRGFQCNTSN